MSARGLRIWITAVAVGFAGLGATWGLLTMKPKPAATAVPEARPPLVQFVAAEPALLRLPVTTQGTVQAQRDVSLTSQVAGRVVSVSDEFVAGGLFSAGEVLLQLETADYELAIARAESQVAASRQRLAEEEGRALQAKREWRDLGTDKANALFLREPQLMAAKADLVAAEAELRSAQLNLERTRLSLPFNGRVVNKTVDLGQFVTAGTTVAQVYGTDQVEVRLPLTDRQLALLDLPLGRVGAQRQAVAAAPEAILRAVFAGQPWEWSGLIERTEASVDVDSRVVYAVATVDKPFARSDEGQRPPLMPGMFVQARIEGRAIPDLARLPRAVLGSDGSVLLVDSESRLERRAVRMLHADGSSVWVSGLSQGERVVVNDGGVLLAGMDVTPTPAQQFVSEAF